MKDFLFSIDLRSLALFRLLTASVLIGDWVQRWPNLEAFYSSHGVMPNVAQLSRMGSDYHYSLLTGATTLPVLQFIFLLGLASYVGLFIGFRTRFCQIASFIFFLSVVNRNEMVSHGGDGVLIAMLLWSMFLPLGRRASLDSLTRAAPLSTDRSTSLAAFALVLQLALVYTLTAVVKTGNLWSEGTAIYYAMHLDNFVNALGKQLTETPLWFIKFLTYLTHWAEYSAVLLILLPFFQPWLRRVFMVVMGGMHLTTAVTMQLGSFPWAMLAWYAVLLRREDWEATRTWRRRLGERLGLERAAARLQKNWRANAPGRSTFETPTSVQPLRPALVAQKLRRLASQGLVAAILLSVLLDSYNLSIARPYELTPVREAKWMRALLEGLHMVHGWYMFAPNPMVKDGWWVAVGVDQSLNRIDPLTDRAPTWEKPANQRSRYDVFWTKYMYLLTLGEWHDYRAYFGRYLTRENHRKHPRGRKLMRFDFYYVEEPTQPHGKAEPFPTKNVYLWSYDCTTGRVTVNGPIAS